MTTITDEELRRHLDVNRQTLTAMTEDEHCWRLGPVEVRKHEAIFRVGLGHSVLPATRFVLQEFDLDAKRGIAVVLVSGGRPPHYFIGWVPLDRAQEPRAWVETLNETLRRVSAVSDIPENILRKHPELAAVGQALEQHRRREAVSVACPKCGATLSVVDVETTGSTTVLCANGHTLYRSKRDPRSG